MLCCTPPDIVELPKVVAGSKDTCITRKQKRSQSVYEVSPWLLNRYPVASSTFLSALPVYTITWSTKMAPAIVEDVPSQDVPSTKETTEQKYPEPLKPSGALDQFKFEETTPVIGREFIGVNIVDDILNADNADERLRDLAITSMANTCPIVKSRQLTKRRSSLPAWRRLLPRSRQPHRRSPKRLRPQARSQFRQTDRLNPPHPSRPQQHFRIRRRRCPNIDHQLPGPQEAIQARAATQQETLR